MYQYILEGAFDSKNLWQKSTEFKGELQLIENKHHKFFTPKPISNYVITNIDFINGKIKLQEFAETLNEEINEEIQTAFEKVWIANEE